MHLKLKTHSNVEIYEGMRNLTKVSLSEIYMPVSVNCQQKPNLCTKFEVISFTGFADGRVYVKFCGSYDQGHTILRNTVSWFWEN